MRRILLLILLAFGGLLQAGCSSKAAPASSSGSLAPAYTYPFLYTFGDPGNGANGTFYDVNDGPSGIAVADGAIYVSDEYYSAVDKFDANGNYLGQNYYGSDTDLGGIAVDSARNVYVANYDEKTIDEFDQNLNFIQSFTGEQFSPSGIFTGPFDVKVDADLNLYVVDFKADLVYKVDQTDTILLTSTFSGDPDSGLSSPYSLALAGGNVYVTDYYHYRVVALNSSLAYTGSFNGSTGTAFGGPLGIAADQDGNLIVVDEYATVQKFTTSGGFLKALGNASGPGSFSDPYFVAVGGPNNDVYVTDYDDRWVDIFAPR